MGKTSTQQLPAWPVLVSLSFILAAGCQRSPKLIIAADLGNRQCTGVAVSPDERLFVNFPRWSQSHDLSVVEIMTDGAIRPFPNEQWNRWQVDQDPRRRFVCVQSVYIDTADPYAALWILDAGNPRFEGVLPNAAKLIQVDLTSNRITRVVRFDAEIAPKGSYLNDVRIDAKRGFAYITDSGLGALVVVNLNTNRSRRALEAHPSTQAESDLAPIIGGRPWRDRNGNVPHVHADGIALSADKEYLYYKALTGKKLYRIATRKLQNFSLPDSLLAEAVELVGETAVCDGMLVDRKDNLYLTDLAGSAILRRGPDGKVETVLADERIRWPDSLAISNDGDLYFTISQIHLSPRFNEGKDMQRDAYVVFRVPGAAPPEPEEPSKPPWPLGPK